MEVNVTTSGRVQRNQIISNQKSIEQHNTTHTVAVVQETKAYV